MYFCWRPNSRLPLLPNLALVGWNEVRGIRRVGVDCVELLIFGEFRHSEAVRAASVVLDRSGLRINPPGM